MSRKHFVAIAQALANVRPRQGVTNESQVAFVAWSNVVEELRGELGQFNQNFDGEKFSDAARSLPSLF